MLFPTFEFAIFVLFVFFISWLIRKYRVPHRLFLIAASFFFYGYWNWRYAFLLFACCIGNFAFALLLEAAKKRAKLIFIAAMVYNVGILIFFKYYLFFTVNANNPFLALGANARIPVLPIVLPVGISFFTFLCLPRVDLFSIVLLLYSLGLPEKFRQSLKPVVHRWAVQGACLSAVVFLLSSLSPEGVAPFIYFQF